MKLTKHPQNPILSPNPDNSWESLVVCNPAAWYEDDKFYLLYRAAGDDAEHIINIGIAESSDGVHFTRTRSTPVIAPTPNGFDAGGNEDPRVVKYGDTFYVTYAFRPYPAGQYWKNDYDVVSTSKELDQHEPLCLRENVGNTALAISKDLYNFKKVGRLTLPSLDDRDVIIFPEKVGDYYYMLHRPKNYVGDKYGTDYPAIWIKRSRDLMEWADAPSHLLFKGEQPWEVKIGGNTPPIRTDKGWLMLYHGVDDKFCYRVGAAILDIDDPTKVLYRTTDFIMEPELECETSGLYKWGVVFPTGNVVVDDTLYVYYGASDQYVCLATCNIHELIDFVISNTK